jgi:hypothetical protein
MAFGAVHVAVRQLLFARRAHLGDGAIEDQGRTGQRVVAVDHHLVALDLGDGVDHLVVAVIGGALELHADLDALRKQRQALDPHQLGVVLAEGLLGQQLDLQPVADRLALQRLFEAGKDPVVAAMEVDQRVVAVVDEVAVRIGDR